ncbi:amidohydrolase family protein [Streptomyces sp. UNOC14_S4]|uniref:N-acyl-D-amino-acid deacylase family protein n=1 Tax=Streptomyces sp. UNOC14_S4 TaxID=2872340 RepID=UPI001E4B7991|nr:amidohydrolase family protein [Streptomyces sp. UNOC14_S4]MCC3769320.1 amidohydrolase family protein [Streptomyces sp. UNOC14_S4]
MRKPFDVVVKNGRWFDGTGAASAVRDLGIRDGEVAAVSARPLPAEGCGRVLDATGRWVLPGFLDIHTHYDAEVLLDPGLRESVRHGVTTVVMGNCSLSTVHATPLDCADLFARVEAVPRGCILDALTAHKTWDSAEEYVAALEKRPLGPNVAAFLGHSDLRAHVMGLGRAVDPGARPTERELRRMDELLAAARTAGLMGLSTMTSPFSRLAGDRHRSARLPSSYATWHEYRRLHRTLRRTGGILQSAPNPAMPLNTLLFLAASAAPGRAPLRTTLLTAIDPKAAPGLATVVTRAAALASRAAGADVRWQHLPVPFELYADGIDLVVFEEFGATAAALHLRTEAERRRLLLDGGFRQRFRREYRHRLPPRAWHRDLYDSEIVACPEPGLTGRSFGRIADERGDHPVDTFLDLVAAHGPRLRWRTTIANHRPAVLDRLAADPTVQFGFADSGAHLRNMAFYNAPLRLLRRVRDAELAGRPILPLERAVHRLTGELASWFGLAAGTLREGDRADLVVVDPAGLDAGLDAYHEAPMEIYGGLSRMVNRNDTAVTAVCVAGEPVYQHGRFADGYGSTRGTGRFLRHDGSTR